MHIWLDYNGTINGENGAHLAKLLKQMVENGHDLSILTTKGFSEDDKLKMEQLGYDLNDFSYVETGVKKNKPQSYVDLAEKFGHNLKEVVFVDDNQINTIFAEVAGVQAVYYEGPEQLEAYFVDKGLLKPKI